MLLYANSWFIEPQMHVQSMLMVLINLWQSCFIYVARKSQVVFLVCGTAYQALRGLLLLPGEHWHLSAASTALPDCDCHEPCPASLSIKSHHL